MSGKRGDDCPVTASVADSPDGPWRPCNKIIIPKFPWRGRPVGRWNFETWRPAAWWSEFFPGWPWRTTGWRELRGL